MSDNFSFDPVRRELLDAIARSPNATNLKQLSIDLGYNHAYLHQFIHRGSPRVLPEQTRYDLAKLLNIAEERLSHTPRPKNKSRRTSSQKDHRNSRTHQNIAYLDHISQRHLYDQHWMVPKEFLAHTIDASAIKLIALPDADDDANIIMIDTSDRSPLAAGEFALDMNASIRIRHIEQISPNDNRLHIMDKNSNTYSSTLEEQHILGRVIFRGSLFTKPLGA